uniref:hypothetical protein n=1 Tax=Acetatifactor sp. TaxID=1872090 RepID=UPI004056F2D9
MNSLILSFLTAVIAVFHRVMNSNMRRGRIKISFCAIWCMDAIFAICGTVISFVLYRYVFHPFLTVRNVVLVLLYILITILFIWLAPSGILLLTGKRNYERKEILRAEYRLNDTLGIVRNGFMILLFCLPVLFTVLQGDGLACLNMWKETEVCGGFCFVAFLILVPVCARQTIFWLRNLGDDEEGAEEQLLNQYQMQLKYRQRNHVL